MAALAGKRFLAPAPGKREFYPSMTQNLLAGRALEVDDVFGDLVEGADRSGVAVCRASGWSAIFCGAPTPAAPGPDPRSTEERSMAEDREGLLRHYRQTREELLATIDGRPPRPGPCRADSLGARLRPPW